MKIVAILKKFKNLPHSRGLNPNNYHAAYFECNTGFYYLRRGDKNKTFVEFLGSNIKAKDRRAFKYKDIKFNIHWFQTSA